jgi:hypothetical protein
LRSTRPRKQVVPRVGASPEGGAPDGAAVATVGRGSGSTSAPHGRCRSRYIPAAVRRAVWERDEGQCTFVGEGGRCTERAFLEFHHRVPFADGGASTIENLALACKGHNAYEADRFAPMTVRESCAVRTASGPSSDVASDGPVAPRRERRRAVVLDGVLGEWRAGRTGQGRKRSAPPSQRKSQSAPDDATRTAILRSLSNASTRPFRNR